MKNVLKRVLNFIFSFIGAAPRGIVNVSIENCEKLYDSQSNTEFFSFQEDHGVVVLRSYSLASDQIPHFAPFISVSRCVLLVVKGEKGQFNRNHYLDDAMNVIYQPGIKLNQLSIYYSRLRSAKYVDGRVAYLSNSNVRNYGHWVQYTLPLLDYYWKLVGRENIDYYYIGDGIPLQFQLEYLERAGVSRGQILCEPCRGTGAYIAIRDNLTQFGVARFNDFRAFDFVRSLFLDQLVRDANSPKRIYVRRGNVSNRKVVDEEKLIGFLKQFGFEFVSMDGLTVLQQALLFFNAEVIIAPHGSALANIVFCEAGTQLLELFPYKYEDWFNVSFAGFAQLEYFYLIGEKVNDEANPSIQNDIKIDVRKLEIFFNQYSLFK